MSKSSMRLRKRAAKELRASRNNGSKESKAEHEKRAAAYKSLAHDEEWLAGEKERSRKRPARKAR